MSKNNFSPSNPSQMCLFVHKVWKNLIKQWLTNAICCRWQFTGRKQIIYIIHKIYYLLIIKSIYLCIYHPCIIHTSIYISANTMYHRQSQGPTISLVIQSIPHILWNPKVRHTLRHSPLLVPILSRLNPVHVKARHSFQTHFIKMCAQVVAFFQVFVPRTLDIIPFTRTRATCTAHLTILFAVQYHLVYPSL